MVFLTLQPSAALMTAGRYFSGKDSGRVISRLIFDGSLLVGS